MLKLKIFLAIFLFFFILRVILSVKAASTGSKSNKTGTVKMKHSLIMFHAIGDDFDLWREYFGHLNLPKTSIITPTANKIRVTYYITKREGIFPAWFNFNGTEIENFEEFDSEGIERAKIYAHKLIQEEIDNKGIPSDKIIIGGFSQGGALALYAGLTFTKKLAAIIAINSWLPMYRKFSESWVTHNRDIPMFIAHGKDDKVIPHVYAEKAVQKLKAVSDNITFQLYDDASNIPSVVELLDMCDYITKFYGPKEKFN